MREEKKQGVGRQRIVFPRFDLFIKRPALARSEGSCQVGPARWRPRLSDRTMPLITLLLLPRRGAGGRKTKWIKGYMRTSESAINFLLSAAAVKLEVGRSTTRQSNSGD